MKYFYILIFVIFTNSFLIAQDEDPFWMPLNMPEGGDVHDIICSGGDTLYIYGGNGIFRSTDYAESWQQIKKGYTKYAAVDSKNHIFASEPLFGNEHHRHSYIVRSMDNGESWDTLDNIWNWIDTTYDDIFQDRFIHDLSFDLSDRLYAVVNYNKRSSISNGDFRIVYTDDLGDTWKVVDTSYYYPPQRIRKIYPFKDSTLAFSIFNQNIDSKEIVEYTNDMGKTIKHFNFEENANEWLIDIQFVNKKEFYIVYQRAIWYTNNGGNTWINIYYPRKEDYQMISDIKVLKHGDIYISINDSLYHTTDNGIEWKPYSASDIDIISWNSKNITFDSKNNLYISNSYGVMKQKKDKSGFKRSTKGYVNYSSSSLNNPDITCDKCGNVYFGYNGIFVSSDNGVTWQQRIIDKKRVIQMLFIDDNLMLASTPDGLYRVSDQGKSWELWNADSPTIGDMIIDHDGIVFATPGSNFMFRSLDSGRTFEGLPDVHAGEAIAINNEGNLFAGKGWGVYGGIYMSTDKGDSWIQKYKLGSEFCLFNSLDIVFHPTKQVGFEMTNECFYMTTDNGETWEYKEYIPDRPGFSYEMALDSLGNFWGGYYRSTNDGQFWEKIDSGIDATHKGAVFSMGVNSNGYIFLITRYGGIYRSRDRYVSVEENNINSTKLALSPPIPNPTTSETNISFDLPEPCKIQIRISDVLGNTISIINKYNSQGKHTEIFNFDSYPSGIYLISLYGNGEVITEKVEVVK